MSDFEETIEKKWQAYQEEKKNMQYPNIMLVGTSGAGKSSLINYVFNEKVAEVGNVEPVTKGYFNLYEGRNYGKSVNLIDTAGYELGQGEIFCQAILDEIQKRSKNNPIHVIWYCISIANKRVQDIDIELINKLIQVDNVRNRLCVVFTKCDCDTPEGDIAKELRAEITNRTEYNINYFETSTDVELIEYCRQNEQECLEINKLIEWSANAIDDEDLRRSFISAQMTDLSVKREEADKIIIAAATAAAAIGAAPIPFSDAPLLVGDQVIMAAKIIDVYGVSGLAHLSKSLIGGTLISTIGKSIAANIIKIIPIVGPIVGGVVNATVASTLTLAIGKAVSLICYDNVKRALAGKTVMWDKVFNEADFAELVGKFFSELYKK